MRPVGNGCGVEGEPLTVTALSLKKGTLVSNLSFPIMIGFMGNVFCLCTL